MQESNSQPLDLETNALNLPVAANGMSAFLAHTRHGQRRVGDTPFDTVEVLPPCAREMGGEVGD